MLNPVKNRRYTDHIVEQLKEYILNQKLSPGERLPSEAELCKTFDVSPGTIREAFHMLEHDGVVNIKKGPGGGLFVSEGNLYQVIESIFYALRWEQISFESLMETRKVLEDRIARLAASRSTKDDITEIGIILEKMEAPDINHAQFVQYDTDFHVCLAKVARNKILELFMVAVKQLHNRVVNYEALYDDLFPVAIRFHREIYAAVAEKQPEKAATAMVAHLEYFEAHYLKDICNESSPPKRR